jgi:hypothetical protein
MLERLRGVQVSEATVRRLTEQAGAHVEAVQTAQSQSSEPEEHASPVPLKQAISSDGAYVPLVTGEWAMSAQWLSLMCTCTRVLRAVSR